MTVALEQHQIEIGRNADAWRDKPLLREIYRGFYHRILRWIDPAIPGRSVEIGSGIGNLKAHLPGAISTDLFQNPWLDTVCDGYDLPFLSGSLSHLILFDVFHHLEAPHAFLREAQRVLAPRGRLILFEPYMSWLSHPVYGLLHHEPVAWGRPIRDDGAPPHPRRYYAAQGNATRLFFRHPPPTWLDPWTRLHAEPFACLSYLLSGGFGKPAFYPASWLPLLQRVDRSCSRWPRLFGARCLVVLEHGATAT
jgi:SAM-dependent methyltransferase